MLPKRVIFAANATISTGAGHVMRLIEISKLLPPSIEKFFIGCVDLPWVKDLVAQHFSMQYFNFTFCERFGRHDIVVIDSYDHAFCEKVANNSSESTVVQVADRYTTLIPNSFIVLMDLPFHIESENVRHRTIAHGIQFLPARKFNSLKREFQSRARKVLVTTGGTVDSTVFFQLVDELMKDMYQKIDFHFVGKPNNLIKKNSNLIFHDFGSGFDFIARGCDTAICAAGTTMWSLLANNLLVGVAAIVENQKENYSYVINSKHALPVFDIENKNLDVGVLRELLFDEASRQNLFGAISGKYDTLGASKVCDLLLKVYQENSLK